MAAPRYWFALHPDVTRPIGGVKQVHRLAEVLISLGREATLIQESASFHPGWFDSAVPAVAQQQLFAANTLDPRRDVVVLPETFLPHLPAYLPGIPKLIFNQNGSYTFNLGNRDRFLEPAKVLRLYRHPDVRAVLCVSEHDRRLLAAGIAPAPERVHRVVNAIEPDRFRPAGAKARRIAFMPRKNGGRDAAVVQALLRTQPWAAGWRFAPIEGLPQAEVARILQGSLAFLAFSVREGFGLPLAEAAACGCQLIGYSGLGGAEVFDLLTPHGTAHPVREGDWLGFIAGLEQLHQRLERDGQAHLQALLQASKAVRRQYGPEAMRASVADALPRWEAQLSTPMPA